MAKQVVHRIRSKWSEIFICTVIGLGPLSFGCSLSAQARSAIESAQVVAAMRDGSLPVEGVQVKLSAPINSSVPMAKLEVMSVKLLGSHDVRLRLACVDRSACLPFFATASYGEALDADTFRLSKSGQTVADQNVSQSAASKSGASAPKALGAAKDTARLRAGAPASLEFEADKIHVRIGVISLQNGVVGDRIRVSSLDHKQIYVAQVVTPTLLKGELLQ